MGALDRWTICHPRYESARHSELKYPISCFLECTLFFNHALYRGNRVVKASTSELNAFNSPNFPPLATGT
jgi:hypothetical protein